MGSIAYFAAGTAWATIFGLSFLVTKSALEAFDPFTLLFLRFALATLVLAGLAALRVIRLDYKGKPRGGLFLVCLFQPIAYFAFETFGVRATATSTAGLILGAMPAAVAAISVPLLRERLTKVQVAGLALSIVGVSAVVMAGSSGSGEGRDSLGGLLLVIGALACAALYNVYSRKASARFSAVETTFAMMASGAAAFLVPAAFELAVGAKPDSNALAGVTGVFARLADAPASAWAAIAYLGVLSSVVAFFLVNLSLSKLKAAQAAVFGAFVTLVSLAAGVVVRGEAFGPSQALAAIAIVGGVFLTNVGKGQSSASGVRSSSVPGFGPRCDAGGALARLGAGERSSVPGIPDTYGSLIGSWAVRSTWFRDGREVRSGMGEWHFSRILGGRGVIDALFAAGSEPSAYGVSLRTYDEGQRAWRVVWSQPGSGEYAILIGRQENGCIVHEGEGKEPGTLIRWSFSEMSSCGFRWTGERSAPGDIWILEQTIVGQRMAVEKG